MIHSTLLRLMIQPLLSLATLKYGDQKIRIATLCMFLVDIDAMLQDVIVSMCKSVLMIYQLEIPILICLPEKPYTHLYLKPEGLQCPKGRRLAQRHRLLVGFAIPRQSRKSCYQDWEHHPHLLH